jgi:hypothetical protein
MDEALIKSGKWPNVAIEAGSDPHEVMKRYGVNEHTLRTACYDHEQHIRAIEELARELWHLVNNRSGYGYAAALKHIEELGIEVDND